MGLEGREGGSSSKLVPQGSDSEAVTAAGFSKTGGRARRERLEADLAHLEATNQVIRSILAFFGGSGMTAFRFGSGSYFGTFWILI